MHFKMNRFCRDLVSNTPVAVIFSQLVLKNKSKTGIKLNQDFSELSLIDHPRELWTEGLRGVTACMDGKGNHKSLERHLIQKTVNTK